MVKRQSPNSFFGEEEDNKVFYAVMFLSFLAFLAFLAWRKR